MIGIDSSVVGPLTTTGAAPIVRPPERLSYLAPTLPRLPSLPGRPPRAPTLSGEATWPGGLRYPAAPVQPPPAPRTTTPDHTPSTQREPGAATPQANRVEAEPLEQEWTAHVPAWRATTVRMPAIVARAETMAGIARRLMRSSGLYAIASLGTPAASLALTPYLAHFMSASEYGLLAVLNTSISLLAGLTQLGLGSAFFRAYNYDFTDPEERRSVLATSVLLLMALSGAFLAIALPLAPTLAGLLVRGGGPEVTQYVQIACLVVAFQNLSVPGFAWLRADDRALAFSLLSMTNVLVTLGSSIALVGYFHAGIAGAMVGNGLGFVAAVAVAIIPMVARSRLHVSLRVARSMLAFGAPMAFNVMSVWVLQLSDRYLLAYLGDFSQTASYAVAYTLGSVLSTIILAPFSLAWPTAMYSISKRADAPAVFKQVFRWFTAVILFAAFGLSLASTVLLDLLFPPSYRAAAPVIPIVAASIALYGMYTVVMLGVNLRRKTWMASVFTSIAAVVNVVCNLVLIPRYGSMGAAASTLIAYLALVVIAFIANQRIYPVPYEVIRAVFAGLMGVALFYLVSQAPDLLAQALNIHWAASRSFVTPERLVSVGLSLVGLVIYGVWLYLLLQIRTIDFRINPAIMRRWTSRMDLPSTRTDRTEEAYARR